MKIEAKGESFHQICWPCQKNDVPLHPNTWAVLMGVRLALYAEVAARCCWSWATGYLAQLPHFDKISFRVGCTASW